MSAETLRRAAALMRERAEAATPGPWEHTGTLGEEYDDIVDSPSQMSIVADTDTSTENAAHIASWHPAVALAVADLLDRQARMCEEFQVDEDDDHAALAVARAYLEGAS